MLLTATYGYGNAMQFSGGNALTVASPGFNDNTGSLECWVNFSGTGNSNGTILRSTAPRAGGATTSSAHQ